MAKTPKSFPGTLKAIAWGKSYSVLFEDSKKPEIITSGVTGSPKEFIKDYEKVSERKIQKVTEVLTTEELQETE